MKKVEGNGEGIRLVNKINYLREDGKEVDSLIQVFFDNYVRRVPDYQKQSYMIGESEYPGICGVIETWRGKMVVIAQGYGGSGWVRCISAALLENL